MASSGLPAYLPPAQVPQPSPSPSGARESVSSWRLVDRIGLGLCWAAGILLCAIAGAIVIYMAYRGIQYLKPKYFTQHPVESLDQSKSGGFLDPLIGTFLLTAIGIALAAPLGVACAVWLAEYGRPGWLARLVESCIEVIAGTPTVVLAIFGLIIFQSQAVAFLSFTAQGNTVTGRSFFTAGAMMSLIALPLVVGATREGLQAIPGHIREASYALGKTKAATIRRVLLPAVRGNIGTGAALGTPVASLLRGTGSTLTSYVYGNSPAGEGHSPQKAYAAAVVLLGIVIFFNFAIDMLARRRTEPVWSR